VTDALSNELVPVDNMAVLEGLDQHDREVAITHMLTEARAWLAHAKEATEPHSIANFRAQMATVAEATKQLGLSKEIQLDAQEMVRRAERGVGVAVRKGQEDGVFTSVSSGGPKQSYVRDGRIVQVHPRNDETAISPESVIGTGRTAHDIRRMTADVTDEQFESALDKAKSEGNVSRTNVVRKIEEEYRPVRRKAPRRALVDDARDVAELLRKTTVRLESFAADDRIPKHKAEVAARLRSHLDNALQVCTDLRTLLDEH
jgi:hypothetical protein